MAIVRIKRKRTKIISVLPNNFRDALLTQVFPRIQDVKTETRCRCVCKSWYNLVGTFWFDSIHEEWDDSVDEQCYLQTQNVPDMLIQTNRGLGFVSDPITRGYKVVAIHQDEKNTMRYAVYTCKSNSGGHRAVYKLKDLRRVQLLCKSSEAFESAIVWRDVLCWKTKDSAVMLFFHHRENKFQVMRRDFPNNAARRLSKRSVKCCKKTRVYATAEIC